FKIKVWDYRIKYKFHFLDLEFLIDLRKHNSPRKIVRNQYPKFSLINAKAFKRIVLYMCCLIRGLDCNSTYKGKAFTYDVRS
ncbi:MAG: hypothetical protein ACFE9R_06845, partial [Candidatus Hermodarchaeota archaeon]